MYILILGLLTIHLGLSSPETIVLDISKDINPSRFILEKKDTGDIITHKYVPRSEFNVLKVVDDKCVIWDGNLNDGRCVLAIAHLFNYSSLYLHIRVLYSNKVNKDLYFEKKDGFWHSTDSSTLPSKHHFNQASYTINKQVKFDVSSHQKPKLYEVEKSTKNGVTKGVYSPKLGVNVRMVVDRNKTIWEGDSSTHLVQIVISYIGNTPCLMDLILKKDHNSERRCFERKNIGWIFISPDTYRVKLEQNDFYLPSFDIKNLDLNKFNVKEYKILGTNTSVYTPMLGTNVQRLVEGNMNIWESKVGDHVGKIWIYSRDGELIRTHLEITDPNNRKTLNNYKRYKDGWKLVVTGEL